MSNFTELNPKQKEAVDHINGPLLIVAGAGSGKTKTLTSRLINLIENGVNPEKILAITFTNKAADEMKERVKKIATEKNSKEIEKMFIGTFHSFGARLLRNEAKYLHRTIGYSIFDDDDAKSLIKKIVKNYNFPEKEKEKLSPAALCRQFSKIKDEILDFEEISDDTTKVLFADYEKSLQANNAFDFDDLIEKPTRLFMNHPEVLRKYQDRFHYILVDEYQDTNTSQYYMIKLLASARQNLSVVGDDQQSIFKFRGSDYRNFLNFEQDWPNAKVVLLEQNYRSTANIIEAASGVIAHNRFQKSKRLWTDNEKGEKIKVIEHYSADVEANWIAERISTQMVFSRVNTPEGIKEDPQSFAILYRTNAQSRALEQALIERGLVYQIYGGIKFYERKEIKDLVAALRYALNPQDQVSLERLKKNFLKRPYEILKESLPNMSQSMTPLEILGFIVKETEFMSSLKKDYSNWMEREENVKELFEFVSHFTKLEEAMEKISLFQSSDAVETKGRNKTQPKGVRLMTVHLSKGLEFDVVFVAGVNEGLLPHQMSYAEDGIEEERRLMYVAMTRAKKTLYLNFYDMPSRFLNEIPPQLVEFVGMRDVGLDDEERWIEYD